MSLPSREGKMIEIQGNFGRRLVEISGGRTELGDVEKTIEEIEKIDRAEATTSQIFDARRIAGKQHLIHASKLALEARERGKSFADSPKIELTCWTAALRQIDKAIDRVGVKTGSNEIAIMTIGENKTRVKEANKRIHRALGIERDDKVFEIDDEKVENLKEAFNISQKQEEISSPKNIILEKIGLLSLKH